MKSNLFQKGLLVAAALCANALFAMSPGEGAIRCDGNYGGHLQGVATDGEFLYWSFTVKLVKTDLSGAVLMMRDVPNHHGDLCCCCGRIYVAVNRGRFNQPNSAVSEVWSYDCATLDQTGVWDLPDMPHGAGGMTCRGGSFFVIGGLPATHEQNYVYEYSRDFKLKKRHVLDTGFTLMGIQTAEWDGAANRFLFGIYGGKGNPQGTLVTDANLSGTLRHTTVGGIALLHIGGRLYAGGSRRLKEGHEGWIEPAPEGALGDDTRYVPAKSRGKACVRFFYEGLHTTDWKDSGFVFTVSGYKPLTEHDDAFVSQKAEPTIWPAVGIGGKRPVSIPDLVRGVRRAAECEETLSFHVPGCGPEDVAKDAELAEAVDAMRREAERLNVRVEP